MTLTFSVLAASIGMALHMPTHMPTQMPTQTPPPVAASQTRAAVSALETHLAEHPKSKESPVAAKRSLKASESPSAGRSAAAAGDSVRPLRTPVPSLKARTKTTKAGAPG